MPELTLDSLHPHLQSDCSQCFGLCCVALPYAKSTDFSCDKPGGTPCRHLAPDYRCGIHSRLREQGFRGCTVYECFGAGQRLSMAAYQGRSWRDDPAAADRMLEIFPVMQQLHEMISYLREILASERTAAVHESAGSGLARLETLAGGTLAELARLDLPAERSAVNATLLEASRLVREGAAHAGNGMGNCPVGNKAARTNKRDASALPQPARRDFMGANLKNKAWRGANLRGALLIAANLQGADLRDCDWIGADLRDADLRGADLSGSLFLTQMQVNSARGDARTKLPAGLRMPAHWG